MKKIFAILIAAVMTVCSVQASFAAQTDTEAVSAEKNVSYKVVGTRTIKQGTLLYYPYNLSSGTTAFVKLNNKTKNTSETIAFKNFNNSFRIHSINSKDVYEPMMGCGSGYGGGGSFTYENTGGKYDVIRVKISDFVDEFNKDGSVTQYNSVLKKNITYRFTEQFESNGDKFYSALFFESGAAITCATPDKNGEVEILVSRNPADRLTYSTSFGYNIVSNGGLTTGGGGGKNRGSVKGLRMGDVDMDGYVDIDDVTCLQRILSETERAYALPKRNGDFDKDKALTIKDATIIQQYLAEYDISQYYK